MQAADNFKSLQNDIKGIGVKADNNISAKANKTAELTVKPASSNKPLKMFADPQTPEQKLTNINSTIEVVKSGGSRLISKVQEELNKNGYTDENGKPITSSGVWNSGTQAAAQKYLKDNADKKPIVNQTKKVYNTVNKNLEAQLAPPETLVKKMSSFKGAYFSPDTSNDAVYWAQKALNNLGYSDASNVQLPLDGKLTKDTQFALTQFQQKAGLPATGALDAKTLSLLSEPFKFGGNNLLYGNFGETVKQNELAGIAEKMLSKMKPDTMVEIPYKVVATAAGDSGDNDSIDEEKNDSKNNGTTGDGLNISLMIGPRISITCQYVEDAHGNSGILFSVAPGAGPGVSASASGIYTYTNADKIDDLTGTSTETGGSVPIIPDIYLSGGSEYIIGKDYTGYDISAGLGFTPPYFLPYTPEMHSDVSFSFLINSDYIMLQYYAENGMYEESAKLMEKIRGDLSK